MGEKAVELDRLGPVVVEPGVQGGLDVVLHRVGRQGHEVCAAQRRMLAQSAHHLDAADVGQLHVQQQQVGRLGLRRGQA